MLIKVPIRSCKSLIGLTLSCWMQEHRLFSWCVGVCTDMFEQGECLHLSWVWMWVCLCRARVRFSVPSGGCFACLISQYMTPCRWQSLELKVNYIWDGQELQNGKLTGEDEIYRKYNSNLRFMILILLVNLWLKTWSLCSTRLWAVSAEETEGHGGAWKPVLWKKPLLTLHHFTLELIITFQEWIWRWDQGLYTSFPLITVPFLHTCIWGVLFSFENNTPLSAKPVKWLKAKRKL